MASFNSLYRAGFEAFFYEGFDPSPDTNTKILENRTEVVKQVQTVINSYSESDQLPLTVSKINIATSSGQGNGLNYLTLTQPDSYVAKNTSLVKETCLKILELCPVATLKRISFTTTDVSFKIFLHVLDDDNLQDRLAPFQDYQYSLINEKLEDLNSVADSLNLKNEDKKCTEKYTSPTLSKWKIVLAVATVGIFALALAIYTVFQTIVIKKYVDKIQQMTKLENLAAEQENAALTVVNNNYAELANNIFYVRADRYNDYNKLLMNFNEIIENNQNPLITE